jgi:hypothetical protein
MGRAKEIIVKVIPAKIANEFVKQHHYSGKVVPNSKLHFGCFLDDKLHGVMSFGSSMDKRKTLSYCTNTLWNEFLELNRMVFDEYLPKYSESRCIAISIKLIKKNAPHIKWIISFADGTMCGDGTIYRASGFQLVKVKENSTIYQFPDGQRIALLTLTNGGDLQSRKKIAKKYGAVFTSKASMQPFINIGAKKAKGFMLGYIYLIDKTCKITVPILPFSKIDEMGAGMYKGKKISLKDRALKSESTATSTPEE